GKLVPPPKVALKESDSVSVNFVPVEKTGKTAAATVSQKDMTFVCKDVSPGKYKIAVQFQAYPGSKDNEKHAASLASVNKKFEASTTPLSYEVTRDAPQSITVDLAAEKVTKQCPPRVAASHGSPSSPQHSRERPPAFSDGNCERRHLAPYQFWRDS